MKPLLPLAAAVLFATANAALAAPQVSKAWIRWLPGDLPAAGYATITNPGDKPVRLTGADSPAYSGAMLHRSTRDNGVEHMHMVKAIPVPAHGSVSLAPGGYHLMLMHAKRPIKPGDTVRVNLHFDDGDTQVVQFPVRPANAQGPTS